MAARRSPVPLAFVVALLVPPILGQQLVGYERPLDELGLSDGCFAVVNTTISSCPGWLDKVQFSGDTLELAQLQALCESSCRADLEALEISILAACTAPEDVMVPGNVIYPANILVHALLQKLNFACLKEPSGEYSAAKTRVYRAQYVMPAEYPVCDHEDYEEDHEDEEEDYEDDEEDYEDEERFERLMSRSRRCTLELASATDTPVPLTLPDPKPRAPGTIEDCHRYHDGWGSPTIHPRLGDLNSCENWASSWEITVEELITWNPSLSESNCFLDPAYSYCILKWETRPVETLPHEHCVSLEEELLPPNSLPPSECACYIHIRDRYKHLWPCSIFPTQYNLKIADFLALNPWIGSDCDTGLWSWSDTEGFFQVCLESKSITPSTMSTPPIPTQAGATKNCTAWHVVGDDDSCTGIAKKYNIELSDFYSWNARIVPHCNILWLGYAVFGSSLAGNSANIATSSGKLRHGSRSNSD
ncbi:hypothetical protein FQN57_004594 [Myotisia sp. PD_48]|nr:hypothetical protein FQN57_004594 [Myotisia sp. PD_48]